MFSEAGKGRKSSLRSKTCEEQPNIKYKLKNRCTTLTVQSVVSTTGKEPCEKGQRVKLYWQTMENAMDVAFKSQKEMGREVEVKFPLENFLKQKFLD